MKMTEEEIKDVVSDEIQRQISNGTFVKNYNEGVIEFTDEQLEETLQELSEMDGIRKNRKL